MKNANGIREGNLLEYYPTGEILSVAMNEPIVTAIVHEHGIRIGAGIYKVVSVDETTINGRPVSEYEGVWLDDTWLYRLNAEMLGNHRIRIGKMKLLWSQIGFFPCDENGDAISKSRMFKFVHDLQNLYFHTTGEELQYNIN